MSKGYPKSTRIPSEGPFHRLCSTSALLGISMSSKTQAQSLSNEELSAEIEKLRA
jgi:hypothetical protein